MPKVSPEVNHSWYYHEVHPVSVHMPQLPWRPQRAEKKDGGAQ